MCTCMSEIKWQLVAYLENMCHKQLRAVEEVLQLRDKYPIWQT